jgi:hypothetical protein
MRSAATAVPSVAIGGQLGVVPQQAHGGLGQRVGGGVREAHPLAGAVPGGRSSGVWEALSMPTKS